MVKTMTHRQLEYFLKTAEILNITKTAKELYISQPSLSEHMRGLEREIGVPLFERRNNNTLLLTTAGQVMVREVQELFLKEQEMLDAVRAAGALDKKKLSVYYLSGPYQNRIPALMKAFHQKNTDVVLQLTDMGWNELNEKLLSNQYDVIFYLRLGEYEIPGSEHLDLLSAQTCLAVSEGHPLSDYQKITFENIRYEIFSVDILPKKSKLQYNSLYELFEKHKAGKPNIIPASNVANAMMNVLSGIAVSILSPALFGNNQKGIKFIPYDELPNTTLSVYWNKNSHNPVVKTFIDFVKKHKNFCIQN